MPKWRWELLTPGLWVKTDERGYGSGVSICKNQPIKETPEGVSIEIVYDPRTGKPWRSMKEAREWYDQVAKEG